PPGLPRHTIRRYAASGLSTVVTDPVERGKGFGRRLVLAARDAIRDSGADLGVFTCDRYLQAFYPFPRTGSTSRAPSRR
ncbi:MAG TPA: GNAT family N-acetyltransferase, partial [Actinomycetota bacterium]|nr:GNAT family N-acetyltransferase [Actinomycetota bacterium]